MKKLCSLVLVLTLAFTCITAFAFDNNAAPNPTPQEAAANAARNAQKEAALEQFESTLNPYQRLSYHMDVPYEPQITSYCCAAAAAVQAYLGYKSSPDHNPLALASSTDTLWFSYECSLENGDCDKYGTHTCQRSYTSPQVTMINEIGVTMQNGASIDALTNGLNKYTEDWYSYTRVQETQDGKNTLIKRIRYDITQDAPLTLWVNASRLTRYEGLQFFGHYINASGIDSVTQDADGNYSCGDIYITDCNYDSDLGNKYTVEVGNLLYAMQSSNPVGLPNLVW